MNVYRLLVLMFFGLTVFGCKDESEEQPNYSQEIATLDSARAVWDNTKPPSFSYEINWSCFCFDDDWVKVTVRDGELDTIELSESLIISYDNNQVPYDSITKYMMIEGLFDSYRKKLNNKPAYDNIEIKYSAEHALPYEACFNPSSYFDDEWCTYVYNFEVIEE